MSDLHFFIRYGLTGVGLVVFFVAGLAVHGIVPGAVFAGMTTGGEIVTAGLLPLIGIAVQGLYIICVAMLKGFFTDEARLIVNEAVSAALKLNGSTTAPARLKKIVADSTFVWLYYTDAPEHLIDWARRRRSYHYLGVELAIASVIGFFFGILYPSLKGTPVTWAGATTVWVLVSATIVWNVAAVYLATLMKQNVDDMELIWANVRLTRDLKGLIGKR